MVSIRLLCATLFAISLSAVASGLPVPDAGGSGSGATQALSCEGPEPTREDSLRNLGSLETGLEVLHINVNKLSEVLVRLIVKTYLTRLGGGRRLHGTIDDPITRSC